MGVEDPAAPFRRVADTLKKADAVFGNLECCLYDPPVPRVMMPDEKSGYDGFFAPTAIGSTLVNGGVHFVGKANHQNHGPAAIMSSKTWLDKLRLPPLGTRGHTTSPPAPA